MLNYDDPIYHFRVPMNCCGVDLGGMELSCPSCGNTRDHIFNHGGKAAEAVPEEPEPLTSPMRLDLPPVPPIPWRRREQSDAHMRGGESLP